MQADHFCGDILPLVHTAEDKHKVVVNAHLPSEITYAVVATSLYTLRHITQNPGVGGEQEQVEICESYIALVPASEDNESLVCVRQRVRGCM